jgi:hypothetical protein
MSIIIRNPDGSVKSVDGVDVNTVLTNKNPFKVNSNLSSFFPSVTGDPLKFNAKQFVASLANAAGNDLFNGIVKDEKIDLGGIGGPVIGTYQDLLDGNLIDNTNEKKYPFDPANYAGVGDPRYTTDMALKDVFDYFMPRINAYSEVLNAGGCQVVNGYICNEDGIPIVQASEICSTNTNLERITPQEIETFIRSSYATAFKKQSDSFINDIKSNYTNNGWIVTLVDMTFIKIFVIRLTKPNRPNSENIYIKYFYDQMDYISKTLNIPITVVDLGEEFLAPDEDGAKFIKGMQNGAPIYNIF